MNEAREQLRAAIVARQGQETDEVFGARLGMKRSYYAMVRLGQRDLSVAIIRRAVALWPELRELAVSFLLDAPEEAA